MGLIEWIKRKRKQMEWKGSDYDPINTFANGAFAPIKADSKKGRELTMYIERIFNIPEGWDYLHIDAKYRHAAGGVYYIIGAAYSPPKRS